MKYFIITSSFSLSDYEILLYITINGCHVGVISMLPELRSQDVWLIWEKARALGTSVTFLHA